MATREFHDDVAGDRKSARIACLLAADFPLAAMMRANPELRERPFALRRLAPHAPGSAGGARPHGEVAHVSPRARALGVRSGMTIAQARALVPGLALLDPSPAAEAAAADALADVAESFSPIVERGADGCVWLDLSGTERINHGARAAVGVCEPGLAAEQALAEELVRRARRVGLEAAAAIAAGRELARLGARCGGARVIAAGREREFLDWMPLEFVATGVDERGDDLELVLKRLGIRRLGELARLDGRALGGRLGRRGAELARLARGADTSRLRPRPRAEIFAETTELEYGIENLAALGFVMRAMLERLVARLELRGLRAGDIALSLGLADRRRDERRITVAAPTLEARALLTLINLRLAADPPAAAVETVRLALETRVPRPAQTDLFLPPAPAPDRLDAALARIAALCGPARVGALAPADSYRPEAARVAPFTPEAPAESRFGAPREDASAPPTTAGATIAQLAIRTLRPAEEVEVLCARTAPEFVRGRTVCARVASSAGPWRRQGEWWTAAETAAADAAPRAAEISPAPAAYARDYYDLALADGCVYRVYRDLASDRWFVDGIYD